MSKKVSMAVPLAIYLNICYNRCMDTSKIYTLNDPRTGDVRYVGRTVQPLWLRLRQHIHKSTRKNYKCAVWIRELTENGLRPDIVAIEEVPVSESPIHEKFWTIKFFSEGADLLNDGIGRGGCNRPKKKIEWNSELDSLLGTIADSRIAEVLDVTRKSVSYRREKLGVPASFDRTRNPLPPPMAGHNRVDVPQEIISQLGTMPDYVLAQLAGLSKKTIMKRRHELGISSYAESTGNTGQYKKGNIPQRWLQKQD